MKNQPGEKLLHCQKNNSEVYLKIDLFLITKDNLPKLCNTVDKILCALGNQYLITIEYLPFCLVKNHLNRPNIKFHKFPKTSYCKLPNCTNCKVYRYCSGIPIKLSRMLKTKLKPIADKPNEIVLEITKNCDHNCLMCFAKSKTEKNQEPSITQINTIMKEMKDLGINTIRFTGGEPFLRKDIFELLRLAKKNNFYVILNTNATLLSVNKIRILEKFVDNILTSVHGYNQITETRITGNKNLFKQKIKNIYRLVHSNIPIIRVGSLITRDLVNNYHKHLKLLGSIGIKNWELYRPMLSPQTIKQYPDLNISMKVINDCIDFLYEINLKRINAKIANSVPFCIPSNEQKARLTLVGAYADDGSSRFIYDAKGYFKPSYFLDINLGDTIKDALIHPFLKKTKSLDYLPKICRSCTFLRHCGGGSRFLAFQHYKNYFRLDPLATIRHT